MPNDLPCTVFDTGTLNGFKKSLLWPGAFKWRIYYHRMWGRLSTTCSNLLKSPNGELIVAVDHSQLLSMASETVDPIDWPHPTPSSAVPPEPLVHSIVFRVAWGDQNSANVCPCASRKRRLIMWYKLSYTTCLLYAWSSCMQCGVWVWSVWHWVVLVQVIYCSKGGWVLFLKEPTASLRGDHELQPQS